LREGGEVGHLGYWQEEVPRPCRESSLLYRTNASSARWTPFLPLLSCLLRPRRFVVNVGSVIEQDLTVGQFVYVIRKRIKLAPEKAIFIFVDEILPPTAALMSTIYEEHKCVPTVAFGRLKIFWIVEADIMFVTW
jgi:hypothetical protein